MVYGTSFDQTDRPKTDGRHQWRVGHKNMQKDDFLGQLTKLCHFKALKSAKEAIKKTPIPTEVLMFIF